MFSQLCDRFRCCELTGFSRHLLRKSNLVNISTMSRTEVDLVMGDLSRAIPGLAMGGRQRLEPR